MKLANWAKQQGINYHTAYRWFNKGLIPNAKQLPTGTILVDEENKNQTEQELTKELHSIIIKLYGIKYGKDKLDKIKEVLDDKNL